MKNKFAKIIGKVSSVGFDEFHQAGSPNKYHELNLVCISKQLNRQYWVTKSFGNFTVIYTNGLENISKLKQHRIPCRNQTEVLNVLDQVKNEIVSTLKEVIWGRINLQWLIIKHSCLMAQRKFQF